MSPELDEGGLRDWLVDYLVNTIGLSPDEIDCDASLNDLAVGSADAVVMVGELSELLGRQLSPVDLWQYPTVNALATYLTGGEVEPVPLPTPVEGRGAFGEREPIAVIGVGCRYPGGVQGPDALWDFLVEGKCGIGTVPEGRWDRFAEAASAEDSAALATTTRWGGFLDDVAAFDAEFFEIPAGEADKMDPQQRLLLEVTSEALEHAGIAPQALRHTQTGVFAGACLGEYGYLAASDLSAVDAWSGTGGAMSIIANRLSYFFDFRGPSVTVDTACSSSLVAVHLACQSLRSGESDTALAAGVNVLLTPAPTRSFDVAEAMSRSGGCHSFDASADGFVRSEGAGVVVLKRLSDAVRDGDRVLAVIRGSAVNQDGRSNGLMAPNPASQMAVLRAAYADAGVDMREVDYVEAHGTGTLLGDPIEARALGTVLGKGRPVDDPLLIGSVKSNLGHMEAAAGVAGLAKAVLALDRAEIPATVGYANPNPHIPFDSLRLKVVAEQTDWIDRGRPRRAGVSSFGFGGTNAHVVLEQAPEQPLPLSADPAPAVHTLVVSAKTPARIAATAGMLAHWLSDAGPEVSLEQLAHTLNHHRGGHRLFATLAVRDTEQAVAGLSALAAGGSAPGLVGPHEGACRAGTVFVYSGQGSQWAGMGRRLLIDEPAFAAAVDDLDTAFVEQVGFSLRDVLESGEPVVGIDRIQPVLVGLQLALTALWRSYGVHPDAVIGHSMGEVAAAVVAGALTAADGLKVIATRSRLMSRLSGQGAMALLEVSGDDAEEVLADYPDVSVAVEASPRQIVIAGPPDQVDAVVAMVAARDLLARRVDVDVASHHSIIDPVLDDLRAELADLCPQSPGIPMFVTTGGQPTDGTAVFDADYWVANLRNPVRFTQAVAAAGAEHATFIEISPNPVLTYAIDDTLTEAHHHTVATLIRDDDDTVTFHTHLNATHTTRPPVTPHGAEPHIPLPTTPWQHNHHWIPASAPRHTGTAAPAPGTVLGSHTPVAGSTSGHLWQARLVTQGRPYPGFRRIAGVDVVPPSVLVGTLAAAAAECGARGVEDVRFDSPLTLDQPRAVQVFTDGETVTISSAPADIAEGAEQHWIGNVTARVASRPTRASGEDAADAAGESAHDPSSIEELMSSWGVEGRAFEWSVDSHEETPGRLRADVVVAEGPGVPRNAALLDAAMDLARLVGPADALMLPVAADSIHVSAVPADEPRGVIDVRGRAGEDDDLVVDIVVKTADRRALVDVRGLRYQTVHGFTPSADPSTVAHVIDWQPWTPDGDAAETASVAVLGDADAAQALRERLSALGHPAAESSDARYVIYVPDPDTSETDVEVAARLVCEVGDIVAELVQRDPRQPATLWILTRGVHEALSEESQRQSCLWALAGVIGAEQPQVWGGLIDIGPADDTADAATALSPLLHAPTKSVMLLRDGTLLKSGLAPFPGEPVRPALRCRPDGAYLITGGLGDLGLLMANWLAQRGARRLVLLGRTGLSSGPDAAADPATRRRVAAIRTLERRGVSVETVAIDSGSAQAMQALLAKREGDGAAPIRGVIHAAGITEGQLLTDLEPDRVRQTVWPKIAGAQVLTEAFPPGDLDFLYFIASAGSVFGVPGQAAYAAGNAYLDALARARHRQGDNTVSLDWVVWEGLGLGKDVQIVVDELERAGSRPVRPAEASAAWEYASRYDAAQVVMAPLRATDSADDARQVAAPTMAWALMAPEELRSELHTGLRAILAAELRIAADQVEVDLPFAEMGLNSVMAISIRRQLEQFVGIELSATMLFNHPTITSFADYLAIRLVPGAATDDADDDAGSVLDSLFDTVESTS